MLYILLGIASGVLSSMGLGGGTVLIPLLSLLGVEQKSAQVVNILVFVIMVIFLLITNSQKKYIDLFPALLLGIVGSITSLVTSIFVKDLDSSVLKILFGILLIILSVIESILFVKKYIVEKK